MACLFYQFGGKIDFSNLPQSYFHAMFAKGKQEDTEEAKILKKIGYLGTDFDDVIVNFLQTGLFDSSLLKPAVEAEIAKGQRHDIENKIGEIYRLIWANFRGTAQEVCEKLSKFLDDNLERLSWKEILQATEALKETGFKGDTHKWADAFLVRNASKFSFAECRNLLAVANSSEGKRAIEDRLRSILRRRAPKEIIYEMYEKSGSNPEDTAALNEFTVDEYVQWLRVEDDDHLLNVLKDFVLQFNPGQTDPERKSIGQKVFAAFGILCKDNDFVRQKLIKNVGVSPELLEEPPPVKPSK